jgi:hypothetical protein
MGTVRRGYSKVLSVGRGSERGKENCRQTYGIEVSHLLLLSFSIDACASENEVGLMLIEHNNFLVSRFEQSVMSDVKRRDIRF